ncbi:MAG: hypothetical protein ACR2PT_09525 [Endozoicomonas sp.]
MIAAIIAAMYDYCILVRNPGSEVGILGFIPKVIFKIGRILIG